RLSRVDIESLFNSGQQALEGARRLLATPEIAETLRSIDRSAKSFEEAMHNLNAAAISLRRIADEVGPDAVVTGRTVRRASEPAVGVAARAEALLATARDLVEPAGPAVFRLQQSLTEVAATARALRHLIENVDRDPGILIRGGNP